MRPGMSALDLERSWHLKDRVGIDVRLGTVQVSVCSVVSLRGASFNPPRGRTSTESCCRVSGPASRPRNGDGERLCWNAPSLQRTRVLVARQVDNHVAGHSLPVLFCFRNGGSLVSASGTSCSGGDVPGDSRFTMTLVG